MHLYASTTTRKLLLLLTSRDERKRWHVEWGGSPETFDADDEKILNGVSGELEYRTRTQGIQPK